MVTKEEINQRKFKDYEPNYSSARVTKEEMARFDENNKILTEMVGDKKYEFEETCSSGYGSYEKFAEACDLGVSTVKRTIAGGIKVTRTFLYRMTVGMHMTLEEANKYFALCGGELTEACLEDYVCMHALLDGDDIHSFVEQLKEHSKFEGKKGK